MGQQYPTTEETYSGPAVGTGARSFEAGSGGAPGQQAQSTQQPMTGRQPPGTAGQTTQSGRQYAQAGQPSAQAGHGGQQPVQTGQEHAGHHAGAGPDVKLEEALTDEMRVALHDFVQSATACEWCAERCIDEGPEMAECIRLCRDVADLATLNVQFIARDSAFGPEAAALFAEAAEACAHECARHPHRHCQECAEVLSRAAQSTRKMLASFGGTDRGTQPRTAAFQQPAGGQF